MPNTSNILDYLDWRGDLPFTAAPFCEADNLVFCMLSFVDFSPAVSADPLAAPVKLSDVWEAVREKYPNGEDFGEVIPKHVNTLFEKAAASVRFRDVYAAGFRNVIEENEVTQFAAVTFILPDSDDSLFIAFRGTDDTLVGWREDFHLSFTRPVRAQELAAGYIGEMASVYSGKIRTGGHSKGGNLALYGAAFCPAPARRRIVTAYSNDGPGFLREIIESPEFAELEPKIVTFVPQSSVVGMLLGHNESYQVIESTEQNGILQHDPFSWSVRGPSFVRLGGLSADGKRHDAALAEWLEGITPEERRKFTDTVFGLLASTGAKTVTDLSADRMQKLGVLAKSYTELDKDSRDNLNFFLRKLAEANIKAALE